MKRFVLTLILSLGASSAFAQQQALVSVDLGIFLAGVDPANGGQPVTTINYTLAGFSCGQPKVNVDPAPIVIAPTDTMVTRWDDPANASNDCRALSAASVLVGVPVGVAGLRSAMRSKGSSTASAWGALSVNPFSFAQPVTPPPAPSNVRVGRQ